MQQKKIRTKTSSSKICLNFNYTFYRPYLSNFHFYRCALLQELISGQRPLILHPYVFLLNRRFKWTDIAVPITETDKLVLFNG